MARCPRRFLLTAIVTALLGVAALPGPVSAAIVANTPNGLSAGATLCDGRTLDITGAGRTLVTETTTPAGGSHHLFHVWFNIKAVASDGTQFKGRLTFDFLQTNVNPDGSSETNSQSTFRLFAPGTPEEDGIFIHGVQSTGVRSDGTVTHDIFNLKQEGC